MSSPTLTLTHVASELGKLFFRLSGTGTDLARIDACSTLADATTIPAELFQPSQDSYVVAIPQLNAEQELVVRTYDKGGNELASATAHAAPQQAPVTDEAFDAAAVNLKYAPFAAVVTHVSPTGDHLLVNCTIEAFPFAPKESQLPRIQVLDHNGKLVTCDFVDLGTSCRPDRRYPTERRYLSTISFCVPNDIGSFVLAVSLDDMTRLTVLGEQELTAIRDTTVMSRLPADQDPRYHDWYLVHHKANDTDLYLQSLASNNLSVKPLFTIVLLVEQSRYLQDMVSAVLAQSYPNFELLLVTTGTAGADLDQAIRVLCARDSRIRHLALDAGLATAEAYNASILAADGDFVAFLEQDDMVEPDLLYCYAKGISDYPTTDLLYCDEDCLEGERYTRPAFKPDWDPDLLCSYNYVAHMLCVRTSLAQSLPALSEAQLGGAALYHLTFLAGEQARNVFHAPRVMYHARANDQASRPASGQELEASRLAIQGHLDRCGINATAVVSKKLPERFELIYHFDEHPLVSIVIPNKDAVAILDQCVSSILDKTTWPKYEIVVVENNSTDSATFAYYERMKGQDERFRVITSETGGIFDFSKVVNDGFAAAKGDYLLMLNNDTEVLEPDWLEQLMGPCMREEIGAVGCKLLYPNDSYQHVGVALGRTHFGPFHVDLTQPEGFEGYCQTDMLTHRMSAVTGACLLTRRKPFEELGGLDLELPVNYNDIDYCIRLRKRGYAVLVVLSTCLRHYESVTRPPSVAVENVAGLTRDYGIFMCRWQRYLTLGDPFYNKNLKGSNAYHTLEM